MDEFNSFETFIAFCCVIPMFFGLAIWIIGIVLRKVKPFDTGPSYVDTNPIVTEDIIWAAARVQQRHLPAEHSRVITPIHVVFYTDGRHGWSERRYRKYIDDHGAEVNVYIIENEGIPKWD